jgi:hypothetical protein
MLDLTINGQQVSMKVVSRGCISRGSPPARPQVRAAEFLRQARLGGRIKCSSMLVQHVWGWPHHGFCLYANEDDAVLAKTAPKCPRCDRIVGRSFGAESICH